MDSDNMDCTMEVEVDVHTVHPCTPSHKPIKPILKNSNCGAWASPTNTPAHHVLTKTNSNIETQSQLQENRSQREEVFPQTLRVRLFPSSPPPRYRSLNDLKDPGTELKHLKPKQRRNSTDKRSPSEEKSESPIETPQSPVPSSPTRDKKCQGLLQMSSFCDPYLPIDPQGRAYICWLMLVTFCYSYNAWCIALRATFPYQTPENTPLWMTADYLCDIVYILDVAFVKPRLMFLHEGFWVTDPVETRKNYRKKLQYKLDVASLIPLDILYIFLGPQWVILRVPRLLKLQTFWEFHQAMDRMLASPYIVRIGKMLFYVFYLIHLNACAYYAMSVYIGLGKNGWVYDNQGSPYIRCFYFATKTATSIGKNPKPEDTIEYLFMTAAWLMGVFVFAVLIGQIRDVIATATMARTDYRKTLDGCIHYLRRLNMPTSLQRRVTLWFNYTWNKNRCFDEARILNSLPFNMKRDVALAVHMTTLSKVQLFRDCSDSLLRDLVLQLRPVSFLPGDVVVRSGEVGHQMYIISSGECCVMSQDESEILATLREGSVFGEISLLGIDGLRRRTATVRSRGYSSLFALSKSDLDAALKHHKQAAQILRIRADQIIRENAARSAKQRMRDTTEHASKHAKQDDSGSGVRRRASTASSSSNLSAGTKRLRPASSLSRRRLSAVSEIEKPADDEHRSPSIKSACVCAGNPLPKIVLSGD